MKTLNTDKNNFSNNDLKKQYYNISLNDIRLKDLNKQKQKIIDKSTEYSNTNTVNAISLSERFKNNNSEYTDLSGRSSLYYFPQINTLTNKISNTEKTSNDYNNDEEFIMKNYGRKKHKGSFYLNNQSLPIFHLQTNKELGNEIELFDKLRKREIERQSQKDNYNMYKQNKMFFINSNNANSMITKEYLNNNSNSQHKKSKSYNLSNYNYNASCLNNIRSNENYNYYYDFSNSIDYNNQEISGSIRDMNTSFKPSFKNSVLFKNNDSIKKNVCYLGESSIEQNPILNSDYKRDRKYCIIFMY